MSNERLMELAGLKLSGEASEAELKELELLLSSDAGAKERYQLLQKFWEHHDVANPAVVEESLQKVLRNLELPAASSVIETDEFKIRSGRFIPWMRAAAAVILLVAGFFFINRNTAKKEEPIAAVASVVEKHNSKGVKSTIELSDGSKIWLNADSKIEYPEVFAGNTREITLHGEAFFEVAKNPLKPFIIHLDKGTIRVLGTSFNVRAYDDEKYVTTSVATGKVAFIPKYKSKAKKQDTLFITPDNKVSYAYNEDKISVKPTISNEDKAWTEGKLIFRNIRFEDMAAELERSFGKKVVFVSEKVKNYRITGSFPNDTLDNIMFYLSRIKDLKYKITNTELIIGDEAAQLP
jgi:ferric-dicitrate binding protein FerR (iron transport regulator)